MLPDNLKSTSQWLLHLQHSTSTRVIPAIFDANASSSPKAPLRLPSLPRIVATDSLCPVYIPSILVVVHLGDRHAFLRI